MCLYDVAVNHVTQAMEHYRELKSETEGMQKLDKVGDAEAIVCNYTVEPLNRDTLGTSEKFLKGGFNYKYKCPHCISGVLIGSLQKCPEYRGVLILGVL